MYKKSIFGILLKSLDKDKFFNLVKQYGGDRHNQKLKSWDHLRVLLYSQMSSHNSLREISLGLRSREDIVAHRSTLSDANRKRDYRIFKELAQDLMLTANKKLKQDFKRVVRILDSTHIGLCGHNYDWAKHKSYKNLQGLKLHMEYNLNHGIPERVVEDKVRSNDMTIARNWPLERDSIYVFDRGYFEYNWWYKISSVNSYFVTRLCKHALVRPLNNFRTSSSEELSYGIVSDEEINVGTRTPKRHKGQSRKDPNNLNKLYNSKLRRIVVSRSNQQKGNLVLITNNYDLSAMEIAELYKSRWQIELNFKWMKQRLKVKKFMGQSENAVKIQIYVALIAQILISLLRNITDSSVKKKISLKDFLQLIKTYLFSDLQILINILRYHKSLRFIQPCLNHKQLSLFYFGH
jgi:hypothetical protein